MNYELNISLWHSSSKMDVDVRTQLTLLYQLRQGWTTSGSSMPCNSIYQMLKLKLGPHDIRGTVHNQPNTQTASREDLHTLFKKINKKWCQIFHSQKNLRDFNIWNTQLAISQEKNLLSKEFSVHTSTCLFHQRLAESFNHSLNSLSSSEIMWWLIFPLNVSPHEFFSLLFL